MDFMKIVSTGVADIRAEPKFNSERVSQLIYGEEIKILQQDDDYSLVEGPDLYQGYIKTSLVYEGDVRKYKLIRRVRTGELILPFGSYLSEQDVVTHKISRSALRAKDDFEYNIVELAKKFMGVPYLWGGTSDFGYDCSGLTQRLYRFIGYELPRNSDWQMDYLPLVDDFGDALPGDLVFYSGHVAVYFGQMRIIHSNGQTASVSITDLSDGSSYSNHLSMSFLGIRRMRHRERKTHVPLTKRYG